MKNAVVVGFEHHVRLACAGVRASRAAWRLRGYAATKLDFTRAAFSLMRAEALVAVGGPSPPPRLTAVARSLNVPIVVVWVGSDVLAVTSSRAHYVREALNLSVAPWLSQELKAAGVDAPYVPFIGVQIPALPEAAASGTLRVLTYLPKNRADFYGRRHVYTCAAALPDSAFEVVGSDAVDAAAPPNVRFLGWVSPERLFDGVDVLLRLPEHDGMSVMVLDALAHARHVIWNHDVPGVRCAANPHDAVAILRELADLRRIGALPLNDTGRAFVNAVYERSRVGETFAAALSENTAVGRGAPRADFFRSLLAFVRKSA